MLIDEQLRTLGGYGESFRDKLRDRTLTPLSLKTFQINVGKVCNQACRHCHVDASPARTESMSREIADLCLETIAAVPEIETVDITGGAPEMNPIFTHLVEGSRRLGKHVIDRCNLTILEDSSYAYLYDFLADNEVEIIASLPHFSAASTDRQRGAGVFAKSIRALLKLNALGYGHTLPLNLVYNPVGLFLSSSQAQLEREFKEKLRDGFGVVFNRLYTINNLPVSRFLESLVRRDKFQEYMDLLTGAFNPATVEGLMCRNQVSVGYDGGLYDCDFNQMLEMETRPVGHIRYFDYDLFMSRSIRTANHCYGCTAGAGSSCGGEISSQPTTGVVTS